MSMQLVLFTHSKSSRSLTRILFVGLKDDFQLPQSIVNSFDPETGTVAGEVLMLNIYLAITLMRFIDSHRRLRLIVVVNNGQCCTQNYVQVYIMLC